MAKTYYTQTSAGTHPTLITDKLTTPPASGPAKCLVYMGPTLGNQWNFSGAVDGVHSLYVCDDGPSLGRERTAT